jgi:50S ribosomal subunit-associated GTPase HflX
MADTLRELRRASIILHVVDAERISSAGLKRGFAEVDYQVMQYGCANGRYAMIVNKADLPGASRGVAELRNGFPAVRMIPVSARTGLGLDKVKRFIRTSV